MRPSEACGLHCGDVDLDRGTVTVRGSYHLGELNDTKTEKSRRTLELFPRTVTLFRDIMPADPDPNAPFFTHLLGGRIEPKRLSDFWYEALDELKIRKRGLYCTKDTFVTTWLMQGVPIAWLENQTGVNYATLRRHYGKWLTGERTVQTNFSAVAPWLLVEADASLVPPGHNFMGQNGAGMHARRLIDVQLPATNRMLEGVARGRECQCEEGDLNPHGFYPTSPSN